MTTTKPVKLTAAQIDMLRDIGQRPQCVVSFYKPALKLVALGLARAEDVAPPFGLRVTITDAGRAALAAAREV